jgi:hypothetical protein
MKPLAHLVVFIALLGVTLGLRVGGRPYYSKDLEEVIWRASRIRARDIQMGWQSSRYETFGSQAAEATILEKLRQQETGLSGVQGAKLEAKVRGLLRYLGEPTFGAYYSLRTRGLRYEFIPESAASNQLAKACREKKLASLADEKGAVRLLWESVRQHDGYSVTTKITAVALDTVKAAISHTNSGKALIVGPARQGFTVAAELRNPGFHYPGTNEAGVLPVLFEFSFLAKIDDVGAAGPLLISLLWIEPDQDWALNRLITDQYLPLQTLF